MKVNKIVHRNMAKPQEPRTWDQIWKALDLLEVLGIPPYLIVLKRIK
jgi:hypothetical protein